MKVTVSVDVARPPAEVFDLMADSRNEPKWNNQVSKTELLTGEPIGEGTAFTTVNRGQTYRAVIKDYRRPEQLTFDVTGKPMDIIGRLTFTDLGGSTRMAGEFDFQPKGVMKLMLPLLAPSIRKDFPNQFANFKKLCEAQG